LGKRGGKRAKGHYDSNPVVVLAISCGGVIIGDVIASRIGARLDIVVSKKLERLLI
jgi:predicted phosphoribosyltransferase